jgi:tetratricopeptide (TPR) repeat protein
MIDPHQPGVPVPAAGPGSSVSISGGQTIQVGDHNTQTHVDVDAGTLPPPQTVSPGQPVHNLPAASAVFVGRDLDQVAGLLSGGGQGVVVGQAAAIHGLGGIGKTELVAHYARTNLDRFTLVWWITADSAENVALGLAALTRRLHQLANLADAQEWAIGWLQSHTGWLLVLDNVEDIDHIRPLLGQVAGRGQVVVTTRRNLGTARWATHGLRPLQLDVLPREASVELLLRLTGSHDRDAADRLAAELGDLPLALEQASAYITQRQVDFDSYRRLLAERFAQVAGQAGEGGSRAVVSVWRVTMDQVRRRSALAAWVMDVVAWLAPDALPEDVLIPLGQKPSDLADAVMLLASYNMITRDGAVIAVHRLVQAVSRNAARQTDIEVDPAALAAGLLAKAVPEDPINNVDGWPRWNQLLPHIDALIEHLDASHTNTTALYLADRAATYRQFQGQLSTAIALFEQVLTDSRRVLGKDHPETLTSRHNLAGAYQSAGQVDQAITLYEQVLTDRRRVLGENHPDTLASRNNLAYAYQSAGQVDQAITLYEQVLTDARRVLGENHPDTLTSRHNLAYAYQSAGQVDQAITLYEQVLTDRRRVLGENHPSTLTSRHNLAGAYQSAGQVDQAITLYEQVLTDARRVLGENHPDTLASRNNLAYTYQSAGQMAEAITLYEQVLTDARRVLGENHPTTQTIASNLAAIAHGETTPSD